MARPLAVFRKSQLLHRDQAQFFVAVADAQHKALPVRGPGVVAGPRAQGAEDGLGDGAGRNIGIVFKAQVMQCRRREEHPEQLFDGVDGVGFGLRLGQPGQQIHRGDVVGQFGHVAAILLAGAALHLLQPPVEHQPGEDQADVVEAHRDPPRRQIQRRLQFGEAGRGGRIEAGVEEHQFAGEILKNPARPGGLETHGLELPAPVGQPRRRDQIGAFRDGLVDHLPAGHHVKALLLGLDAHRRKIRGGHAESVQAGPAKQHDLAARGRQQRPQFVPVNRRPAAAGRKFRRHHIAPAFRGNGGGHFRLEIVAAQDAQCACRHGAALRRARPASRQSSRGGSGPSDRRHRQWPATPRRAPVVESRRGCR